MIIASLPSALIIAIIIMLIVVKVKSKFTSWKANVWVAGAYLAGLILLVPVLGLLPIHDFIKPSKDVNQTVSQLDPGELFQYAAQGHLDKQNGVYKNSSRTFKLDGNKLGFAISDAGYNNILIERKKVDDGQIEVSTYTTSSFIDGIDFTKQIAPPTVSFQNNTLLIKSDKQQRLDFTRFEADFTLDQFKHINMHGNQRMASNFGWKVLYVRVPQKLEIDKGNYNVKIVSNH
ncbi:MAG: hypothetical protein ACYCVD_09245 [Desulfitobacteriaceae bacterium]